jgi:hypothetical protein
MRRAAELRGEEIDRPQAAFRRASVSTSTPMMSLSFMIRYSTPSILTSVPDHLPNSTRSPALTSIGISWPVGDDLALLRLFLRGVGNDDPPRGLFLGVNALDDDTVVKRTEFHRHPPKFLI